MQNELPCEDYYFPLNFKTLKELLFLEEDQALADYLKEFPNNTYVMGVYSNNDLIAIEIDIKGEKIIV